MDTRTQELLDRTFNFGVNVTAFLYKMKYNEVLAPAKKQLAKACTSIGANYEESQAAESKKDFIHKIGVVCKECRESHYWTRVLKNVCDDAALKSQFSVFEQEAFELKSIFSAIKLSSEGKRNKNESLVEV